MTYFSHQAYTGAMLGKTTIIFTRSKAAAKRISSLVLAVFMLQVIAAGFCVSTASATAIQHASAMEHCMNKTTNMSDMRMDKSVKAHACAHCDMPDASLSLDKHVFSVADVAVDFIVVALAATVDDVRLESFADSPPDLLAPPTSLTTYNLNLRIRV